MPQPDEVSLIRDNFSERFCLVCPLPKFDSRTGGRRFGSVGPALKLLHITALGRPEISHKFWQAGFQQ